MALASIRDVSFNSTPEALQLVTDILTNNDNSGGWNDAAWGIRHNNDNAGAVTRAVAAAHPGWGAGLVAGPLTDTFTSAWVQPVL